MRISKVVALLLAAGLAGAGSLAAQTATAPATRPADSMAQEHANISLDNMPLQQVLAHYGKLSGLKIEPDWDSLKEAGITPQTPVTLKAYGLSFAKLLDLTVDSVAKKGRPLAWYRSGEIIHISTQIRVLLRDRPLLPPPGKAATTGRRAATPEQINFDQTPLHMVIDFVRDLTGLNIHVNWRSLETTGITRDTPITLKAHGISVRRLLDLLMDNLSADRDRFSSVYWILDEGVIQVATGDAFNRSTQTRIFDVSDLIMPIPNFQGPRVNLQSNTGQTTEGQTPQQTTAGSLFEVTPAAQPAGSISDQQQRSQLQDSLIDAIKQSIGEEMWAPQGKGSIRILKGQMIITQTPLGFKLLQRSMTLR